MQRFAGQTQRERGQECRESGRFHHADTGRVRHHDIARRHRIDQPRDPDLGMRIERQRIEQAGIESPPQPVDALHARDRADIDLIVAHREVRALDQQEPQIARQMRLFGIAGVEPSRCQQPDARFGPPARRRKAIAHPREKRRMPLDIQPRLQSAQCPRHRQPVFQRIACPRRRAQMIGEHAPAPFRTATQIGGEEMQMLAPRRLHPHHRAHEERAARDQRRRYLTARNQSTGAVDIGDHAFHQLGTLGDTAFDPCPFVPVDQQRNRRQRPGALVAFAGDAKAGADILGLSLCAFGHQPDRLARDAGRFLERHAPCLARIAGGTAQHVGRDRLAAIFVDPAIGDHARVEQVGGRGGEHGAGHRADATTKDAAAQHA